MIPFAINPTQRPDRLTADKDEKYHLQFARYCGVALNNPAAMAFYWKVLRNRLFYIGQQWDRDKDTAFLEDSDGAARGRIPTVDNIIRPFVNQMINEATNMNLNFKAMPEGDRVINRREKDLAKMKSGRVLADRYPALEEHIKKTIPIGKNMDETEEIFRNVWTDSYAKNINNLTKYVANKNKLDSILRHIAAESLAVNGLSVLFNECINGEMVIRSIDPEDFFYDNGARYYDLSDSEYMGHTEYALPTDLYERYNLSEDTKKRIEKYTKDIPIGVSSIQPMPYAYTNLPGRIPKIYVQWRDSDKYTFGYVIDQFGYELLTRVYPNNYKPKNNERIYFEKDLVMPQSEIRRQYMNGKLKRVIDTECLRYCVFTPSEIYTGGKGTDIVYEYGIVPYQETYALDPSVVEFSYRCVCWGYHDGWISSPVDDMIDPQRLVNRYRSIAEAKANKDSSGLTYDTYALMGNNINEAEFQRKIERGETIGFNTKGMGVPNAIGSYGDKLIAGAQAMTAMANEQVQIAQQRTGILSIPGKESKKALMGAEAEEQSLHGLYMSRLVNLFEQEYQCIANKGKRIYADSPRRLAIMVGDKGAEEIRITKDMMLEDFRIRVSRQDDEKQSKQAANLAMTQLLQTGVITKDDYADNYDRITLDQVGKVIRDSFIRVQTAQKAAQQEQQQQQQQQQMMIQANMERAEIQKKIDQNIELSEAEKDRKAKLDAIILRGHVTQETAKVKHNLKLEEMKHDKKD